MSTRQDKSLHDACSKGKLQKAKEILEKGGDVVSILESRLGFLGYTPLHNAACHGHNDVLRLLLIYGGDVNARANGNYTPLHIAASMDYVKCIKVLLKNNADIRALDDFHKTPYQTAMQHRRKDSAKCLKSAEIIQAAKENPQELQNLLNDTPNKDITEKCFDESLIEASHVGNFDAVCMLLVAGAINISDCIGISIRKGHYKVTVLLLICYATISENIPLLETLLHNSVDCSACLKEFIDESLPLETVVGKIRESLKICTEECTNVAIRLPGDSKSTNTLKVLLLSTSCNRNSRKVNWSKLFLGKLHESWIDPIKTWVQYLNLSSNKLTSLPEKFVNLKLVVRLNLSANKLKLIPGHIFSLVCLRELDISSNAINEIADDIDWKPTLKSLNVGDNNLSGLPVSISLSRLETLNLSKNNFTRIPLCLCEITSLKDLDLSNNREINELPNEMGKLRNLTQLHLKNLDQITDPPERMRRNAEVLVATLRRKLRSCQPYYTMKLMLVGKGGHGKTTLVRRLQDNFQYKENDLTQGVEITELVLRKSTFDKDYHFKVWDFGGQEDYYATHQCFLSTMSLYLLVWRLIDGEEGVNGLIPWLDNIAVRSPGSTVIVVGTHLDCLNTEKDGRACLDHLKNMVLELVSKPRYKNKVFVPSQGICAVSCAFGDSRARTEINILRQVIYDTAGKLKKGRIQLMGELIPYSFFDLIGRIEERKLEMLSKNQPPIIIKEEFHTMVQENAQSCKRDIEDSLDVRDATVFLRERGIVMHFDDPNEGLNDLYFIDPRWLCSLMARVVTVKNYADIVQDGILEVQRTSVLFRRDDLPIEFLSQYIRLLVRFQVAYPLDESRILVPSKLPEGIPEGVESLTLNFAPVRRMYKIDYQRIHGFWTRFMSRFFFYMKEMIAVDPSRYQKSEDSEHGFSAKFCLSCVHVELTSTTFPCFLDITESSGKDEVDSEEKGSDSTSAKGTPVAPQPSASVRPQPAATNGRLGDSLQMLFLDPSVKIFSVEDLEGGDSDDDDGIVINYVDTAMGARSLRQGKNPGKRSRRKTPKTSQKSQTGDKRHCAKDESRPTSNGDHPTTVKTDSSNGENVWKSPDQVSSFSDEFRQERELNENIAEDVIKNSPLHNSCVTSSNSFESEKNDGNVSSSEQPNHSSISSRTPSDCSSSLVSTMDNFPDSDLLSESGSANPDKNSMSASMSGSVTSEDPTDFDGASYGYTQNSVVPSSAPNGTQSMEECQDISTCEDEEKNKDPPGSGTTDEACVDESDLSDTKHPTLGLNAGSGVFRDTTDGDESSPKTTAPEVGAMSQNSEVADITDPDSDVAVNGVTDTDVTDVKIDVFFDASPVTKLFTDSQCELSGSATTVVDGTTNVTDDVSTVNDDVLDPTKSSENSDIVTTHTDSTCSSIASNAGMSDSQSSIADQPSLPPDNRDNALPTNDDHLSEHGEGNSTFADQSKPENIHFETRDSDVEKEKCTLCKEYVPADELVTIPLDVADLIQKGYLQCWRSGICMTHPNVFLLVSHRSLSDTFVVECAVSPSPLGRRLLVFVVDHLDTLIKEWYPGLLLSYGTETVQKLIPCRVCEKDGIAKPHMFTFDSCVTQYSMGNFVKCPRHEVSIQDIAPDVVLHDIDSELLLDEEEIEYERIDANKIGDGGFGKVYRGRCRGKDAAIKEYSTANGEEDAMKRYNEVRKELNVLRRVGQHPFLVNFIGVCLRPFRLVLELAVEGSLGKTLFNPNFIIDRVVVYRMVYQVAEALSFLHSLNVIYRDLKPDNILVMSYKEEDDVNIKLTDFGTATFQFSEGLLALEGTAGYHAPEMLKEFCERTGYNVKVDVFSLGMLIYGFVTRRQPFYNINSPAEINDMVSNGSKPAYDDVLASRIGLVTLTWLMEKCLQDNTSVRPCSSLVAAQVRSTPFQIFLGVVPLPCPQSVRHVCVVEATRELWVAVDDKAVNTVLIYELTRMCLKKKFTINRLRPEDPPLCMQINCMHVTTSRVLIGLRGDLDVVTLHDMETYELKENISLPEPVFCMSSNDEYIFLGMSSGVFRVVPTTSNGRPQTVEVSHSEPITCMLAVDNFLWLTVAKVIQIFHTVEAEGIRAFDLNAVRFSSSNSQISHTVLSTDQTAVWCVSTGDSVVTGWDIAKRQKLCEFDCKSLLTQALFEETPLNPLEVILTCILAVLDTVWVGTVGGMVLILDARSGELITWMRLFDDHVRTLTLISGPGPSTDKCYVVISGKNLQETALSRGGKTLCPLSEEVIRPPPKPPTPTKEFEKTKSKRKNRAKSPGSDSQKSDVEDSGPNLATNGGFLLFFEVLPADVLLRIEAKS